MPETVIDLGKQIKKRHPGVYDSYDDATLGRAMKAKDPKNYGHIAEAPQANKESNDPGILQEIWDLSGKPLLPISKLSEPYKDQSSFVPGTDPRIWSMMPASAGVMANPGAVHGVGKAAEGFTSPRTLAMGGLLSKMMSVGFPGFTVGMGLAGDTFKRGYDAWKRAGAAKTSNEKWEGRTEALIDVLTGLGISADSILGLKRAGAREGVSKAPTSILPSKKKTTSAPVTEKPAGLPSPQQTLPILDEEVGPKEPWYVKRDRELAAKKDSYDLGVLPEKSSPLPDTDVIVEGYKGPIHPKAAKAIDEAANMRMNEIAELFESGLGELSGKGKNIEGAGAMSYAGEQGVSKGFGKIRVKGAAVPEVSGLKETPGRMAKAIREDGNNPLYKRILERVRKSVIDRHGEDIQAMSNEAKGIESESFKTPEGYYDYEKAGVREPGQEGFADIESIRPKGKKVAPADLRHGFIDRDGNAIDIGSIEHRAALGGTQARLTKAAQAQGLIRVADISKDSINIDAFGDVTPAQMRTIAQIRKNQPEANMFWQDSTAGGTGKYGIDWRSFVDRFGSQEGFGDFSPTQRKKFRIYADQQFKSPEVDREFFNTHLKGKRMGQAALSEAWPTRKQAETDMDFMKMFLGEEGFADTSRPRKGYAEEKYPISMPVRVEWKGEPSNIFADEIKGLNPGHALWRAKDNWAGADKIRLLVGPEGEEGWARSSKDQESLPFVPMSIPGQMEGKASDDLLNQILQAPDAAVSKRELLNLNPTKPKAKKNSTPLFEPEGKLF